MAGRTKEALELMKKLVDAAVQRGLFQKSEDVISYHNALAELGELANNNNEQRLQGTNEPTPGHPKQ